MTIIEDTVRLLFAPVRICVSPLTRFVSVRLSSTRWQPRAGFSLPIGGLDVSTATTLYFSIRQATDDDSDYESSIAVPDLWLQCLVASQLTSERLLVELRTVEFQIQFWKERLRHGRNQLFFMFSRGPVKFLEALASFLRITPRSHRPRLTASDSIEQRLATLRTIRRYLAVSLARLHQAARHLHITPKFVSQEGFFEAREDPDMPLTEEVEGSTAWSVATAADICSKEVLYARNRLQHLAEQVRAQFGNGNGNDAQFGTTEEWKRLCHTEAITDIPEIPSARESMTQPSNIGSLTRREFKVLPEMMERSQARLQEWMTLPNVQAKLTFNNPADGLRYATQKAHRSNMSFVPLPGWVCASSRLQRHWLRYTVNGAVVAWGASFLIKHSPLCGSDDLERWLKAGAVAVSNAFKDNILRPLLTVRDEFFETFQARSSIVSRADFEASKQSLQRMLADFERDTAQTRIAKSIAASEQAKAGGDSTLHGMDNLMRHYEAELRAPIRNALSGTLPRSLLIQIQKLKVDTESAMLEMDQILRANELTMAVTAALPAILIAGGFVYLLARLLWPRTVDLHTQAAPARLAMVELERAIDALIPEEDVLEKLSLQGIREGTSRHGQIALAEAVNAWEKEGILLVRIAHVRAQTHRVFSPAAGRILPLTALTQRDELRQIEEDLFAMAAATSARSRSRTALRMHRVYTVYKA